MSKVFISYSTRDSDYVTELANTLRELGQEPFYASSSSLTPGLPFMNVISESLREADAIVFVISQNSESNRFVMAEAGSALGYFEERGRPIILPVVIDQTPLPPLLSHIQAVFAKNLPAKEVATILASAIERSVGRNLAQEEKKQEVRERVESKAAEFIQKSLVLLRDRESHYKVAAYFWYGVAFLSLVAGLGIGVWRGSTLSGRLSNWQDLAAFAVLGFVILGLLVAVARFAFMLGKSFMVEALRVADRIHAISFGEFYLMAFPDRIEWEHVKDAFQNWNIDKGSYFLSQSTSDFDNEVFKLALAVAEAIKGTKNK